MLEVPELVANVLLVLHLLFILHPELLTHLLIMLAHLLLFKVLPLTLYLSRHTLFLVNYFLLLVALLHNVAHEHLLLESFDLILLLIQRLVSAVNGLKS
jgi:hypothetical protein